MQSNSETLIVIDGLDASGKNTQSHILTKELELQGNTVRQISFPRYGEPSSVMVDMYLKGKIGSLDEVNPYAASLTYTLDRYISYMTDWKKDYEQGVIVADRYSTSNIIHQLSKLPESEWADYADWLMELEYDLIGLPEPDIVLFLDMNPKVSRRLLESRGNEKDIHEKDQSYLERCYYTAQWAADELNWAVVNCDDGEEPYSIDIIRKRINKCIEWRQIKR